MYAAVSIKTTSSKGSTTVNELERICKEEVVAESSTLPQFV
jgi:hypothetical protein